MTRRQFVAASASALTAGAVWPTQLPGQLPAHTPDARAELTGYFHVILAGFLRNARATGRDYAVCDFPEGTMLKSCLTPNGRTYVSVARMLPALAEYIAAGQPNPPGAPDLAAVLLSIFRTAFDPRHPDYWAEPAGNKPTQRTVESSLVAIALARMGPEFVAKLTPAERANINRWLASCTVIPERTNNHAWFTAVNQAARLKLSRTFPEFTGDEAWMIDDLKAMDVLAANAADGWYSDDPKLTVYDYYNFWTFGNFPLFWSRIAGDLYPEWNVKLRARAREFLNVTPHFFAADGAVPLFGRSLLYRWALLSPLLLGYEQGIWPHSPGLLRRIVQRNLAWWWQLGAFDEKLGKLRETLSPEGTPQVTEGYIDNGHPYWAMQTFTFFSIPARDPLWTAPEEPLPVEKSDFMLKLTGPKMILAGTQSSGQVRWLQAKNTPRRDYYRDKYSKFTWSSSFPFNVLVGKDHAPWDQALVLRDPQTGACATRIFPDEGSLLEDGVATTWTTTFRGAKVRVVSVVRLAGEFEYRRHELALAPAANGSANARASDACEVLEGSFPLGLGENEEMEKKLGPKWLLIRSRRTGYQLVAWIIAGYEAIDVVHAFDPKGQIRVNFVHPRTAVISLSQRLTLQPGETLTLASLHHASPRPAPLDQILARAAELRNRV